MPSEPGGAEARPARSLDSIDVNANADLGGTLLSKWLLAYSGPEKMEADSRVEGSLGATEIVLAIDTTGSMDYSLDGSTQGGPTSRMAIVKKAAVDLGKDVKGHCERRTGEAICRSMSVDRLERVEKPQAPVVQSDVDGLAAIRERAGRTNCARRRVVTFGRVP